MVSGYQIAFPPHVAQGDRLSDHEHFDFSSDASQIQQIRYGEGPNSEPLLRGCLEESLGRQSDCRFSHDSEADATGLCHLAEVDSLSWPEAANTDVDSE